MALNSSRRPFALPSPHAPRCWCCSAVRTKPRFAGMKLRTKLNPVLESWRHCLGKGMPTLTAHWPTGWEASGPPTAVNKVARAIAMEARLAAADTEYGALEAMAFEAEGLRSQIRDQARLASAYRGVAASPTKGMLRDASEAASNQAQRQSRSLRIRSTQRGVFARAR